jgi:hypothetical protein
MKELRFGTMKPVNTEGGIFGDEHLPFKGEVKFGVSQEVIH